MATTPLTIELDTDKVTAEIRAYIDKKLREMEAEVERLRAEAKRQQQWKADVLREAAHEIESRYPETVWLPDSNSPDAQAAKGVRVACKQLRHMADEIDADALDTAGTAPAAGGEKQ